MSNPLFQLDGTPVASRTPAQIAAAKAQKLATLKQRVLQQAAQALRDYDAANRRGIAAIHNDPDFTPAEGWAALGPDAVRILQGSGRATDHIESQASLAGANYAPPTLPNGLILTPNADGTVTAE